LGSRGAVFAVIPGTDADGVEARITIDGRGFDPDTTLVQSARDGHLGLVGVHERVRMLGGRTQIESRPRGPTVISAHVPGWPE
jgi:NarL family two-component system sensor histidine kinase YdfH